MNNFIRILLISISIFAISCQAPQTDQDKSTKADKDSVKITEDVKVKMEQWQKDGITIYPKKDEAEFPNASLELISPQDGDMNLDQDLHFKFSVKDYELGVQTEKARDNLANSGKGQHIHLIIDNNPYSAHYEPEFDKEIEPGLHYAIAFLSRSYHESIKNGNSAEVFQFVVGEDPGAKMYDLNKPMLFYSRPKGTYSGEDAKKILLDFYLHNAELNTNGYHVRATINGKTEFVFERWRPYIVEGLPMGKNTIKLELIDSNGNPVGDINSITREFTLEE